MRKQRKRKFVIYLRKSTWRKGIKRYIHYIYSSFVGWCKDVYINHKRIVHVTFFVGSYVDV